MAQTVKCQTVDVSLSHDLMVCEIEACVGLYADSMEPAWDSQSLSLSVSLSAPPQLAHWMHVLFLKINKLNIKKKF